MKALFARLVHDDEGQDLIEYALLAAFISLACLVAMETVGGRINDLFGAVSDRLEEAAAAAAPAP